MGFLSNIVGATVKVALTPVAVVKDTLNVLTDEEPESVKNLFSSAGSDIAEAMDNLDDGDVL